MAQVQISADIYLPPRVITSPGFAKLSLAWSPECKSVYRELFAIRTIAGALAGQQLGCESRAPESLAEGWDTLAVQIMAFNRLWTFELRESAHFSIGFDEVSNLTFDLHAIEIGDPADRVTLTNVEVAFRPDEKVICSPKMFDVAVQLVRPRIRKSRCHIDKVIFI